MYGAFEFDTKFHVRRIRPEGAGAALASVQIRSVDPRALILPAAPTRSAEQWLTELYGDDVAAYIDAVLVPGASPAGQGIADVGARLAAARALADAHDPTATVLVVGLELGADRNAARRWLISHFSLVGDRTGRTYRGSVAALTALVRAAVQLEDLITADVVTLDPATVSLQLAIDGEEATARVPHRLFYHASRFSTILVYWGPADASGTLHIELNDQGGRVPAVRDAIAETVTQPTAFVSDPTTRRSRVTVPLSERPVVLDFDYEGADVYVDRVTVAQAPTLTVAEVIVNHQQAQAAQDALYSTYVAAARMEQRFRPTPTDAFEVVTDNRHYVDGDGVEWEELDFWAISGFPN